MKSMMNVAQILQGLNYKVCSTTSPNFTVLGLFILVFGISPNIWDSSIHTLDLIRQPNSTVFTRIVNNAHA